VQQAGFDAAFADVKEREGSLDLSHIVQREFMGIARYLAFDMVAACDYELRDVIRGSIEPFDNIPGNVRYCQLTKVWISWYSCQFYGIPCRPIFEFP
jgi:hypothetical protein